MADASDGSAIITAAGSSQNTWVSFCKVAVDDTYFFLQNVETGMYFRPSSASNGASLEQRPKTYTGTRTQWWKNPTGDHVFLRNRWTDKHIRPNTSTVGGPVVQQPNTWTGSWTPWQLEPANDGVAARDAENIFDSEPKSRVAQTLNDPPPLAFLSAPVFSSGMVIPHFNRSQK